jgi:hypothetical protein
MKEILAKAAEILSTGGHIKYSPGNTQTAGGPHCAVGALAAAQYVFGMRGLTAAIDACDAATREQFGYRSLIDWNNAPATTGEDVILLFKELAHDET